MTAKKVLIIDDSPLVLAMARDILQTAGYTVYTATNGIDANQYIFSPENRPDLIIIDVMMPLLAGNKKAQLLKQSDMSKNIPILFISTKDEAELKKLVIESGINGYICKPFTDISLVSAVKTHI